MAKPVMPSPSIPIVTGSPMTRPWVEFLRSLVSSQGQFPTDDPAANPTPTAGMSTVDGGHLYVCLTDGAWTQVI